MTRFLKSSPLLALLLAALTAGQTFAQTPQCEWTNVERIVAVGDVHGDYDQLVKCLLAAGVINQSNQWVGGKTHLVQTGDIFDRGPDSKKAMDLLMDLEPAARNAGGDVHALIGNHEIMVLTGSHAFLTPAEIESHGGLDAFLKAVGPDGKYGKWIRGHNTIIRINDILFVHGGISEANAAISLSELNQRAVESIDHNGKPRSEYDLQSLTWSRRLALDDEASLGAILAGIFRKYEARHVVIGHTVVEPDHRIKTPAHGAVIMIDVGMSKTYVGGPAMCLVVESGKFYAVTPAGREALPMD